MKKAFTALLTALCLTLAFQSCGKDRELPEGALGVTSSGESLNTNGALKTCDSRSSNSSCAVYGFSTGMAEPGCMNGVASDGANCPRENLVGSCLNKFSQAQIFYDTQTFFYAPHFSADGVKSSCQSGFIPSTP